MITIETTRLAIVGLGYVGLPLAVEFGKKMAVTGFDIAQGRIDELNRGIYSTLEVELELLKQAVHLMTIIEWNNDI